MKDKKGQAIVEYVLLVSLVALAFVSTTDFFNKAVEALFTKIGNSFAQKGP